MLFLFYNYYHMSSNPQIDNRFLLENKPYLTKQEVALLLQKKGKNLDKKILQFLNNSYLLSLKKGLYTSKEYIDKNPPESREYLSNVLYYPSYLSLEYVLQKEGLIPEAVYAYTSVTVKPTQTFSNSLGVFIYRAIKEPLFTGYQLVSYNENYQIKIASRAKALFDLLYLKSLPSTVSGKKQELLDLRINWDGITSDDTEEFDRYVTISQSPKMRQIATIIFKLIP